MIGQTIAHYRITGKLGEGGMGAGQPKAQTHLTFLLNFFDELRRRDAAGGAK